jgi:hypothetical protein
MPDPWIGKGRNATRRHPAGRAPRLTLAATVVAASWFLLLAALGIPLVLAFGVAVVAMAVSMVAFGVAGGADTSRARRDR